MPTTVYNKREADKFITGKHVDLVVVECTCGLLFAIPENLYSSARRHRGPSGWQISCPLGHTWHYTGDNESPEEERLRKQLESERDWSARIAADRDQVEASLRATKGVVTRMKKRASAGVCPCCNRTFQQLALHMQTKHPSYVDVTPGHLPTDRPKCGEGRAESRAVLDAVLAFLGNETKAWIEIQEGVGITKGHTSNVLHRMLHNGEIERVARGRYKRAAS